MNPSDREDGNENGAISDCTPSVLSYILNYFKLKNNGDYVKIALVLVFFVCLFFPNK